MLLDCLLHDLHRWSVLGHLVDLLLNDVVLHIGRVNDVLDLWVRNLSRLFLASE